MNNWNFLDILNAIVKFLKSEERSLSVESVYNYLEWLEKAFAIYCCQRYDRQGKSILKTQEKFYQIIPDNCTTRFVVYLTENIFQTRFNAGGGTRTHTPLRITDFESVSSANSDTPAYFLVAAAYE